MKSNSLFFLLFLNLVPGRGKFISGMGKHSGDWDNPTPGGIGPLPPPPSLKVLFSELHVKVALFEIGGKILFRYSSSYCRIIKSSATGGNVSVT